MGMFQQLGSLESVANEEEVANAYDCAHQERYGCSHERGPKGTSFISTLVQVPDSVLPKNVIGVADIRRVDFLIAETSMMNLLSHHHLHKRKRSEQNGCYAERDFVQWHKDKFYS
jgi:hypothetical protein